MLIPRRKTPQLAVETLDHGTFDLDREGNRRGTLICFYRGLHCSICAPYLNSLEEHVPLFAERGVATIAISSDDRERARRMAEKVNAKALRIGYGLDLAKARQWGLYLSASRGKTSVGIEEPAIFPEPGIFMVQPDRSLYWAMVQSMPYARPHFPDLLNALDRVIEVNYPARGEYAGLLPDH